MTEHYFQYAFGVNGTLNPIPNPTQISGTISYQSGFPIGYQLADTAPGYLSIPRDSFNQLMNDVTGALQMLQQRGFPSFITSAANGGSPYSYDAGAQVWYSGQAYYSLVSANTDTPPSSKWGLVQYGMQSFLTSDVVETMEAGLPSGWLWTDGKTIGSATSGATSRANADTLNLFTSLWNSVANAALPIQDSSGNPSSRGVSAAADFAANKRMPLPDKRGRVTACADNLGGTAAGRLTGNTAQGVDGTILGNSGGEQSHTPVIAELLGHTHGSSGLSGAAHYHSFSGSTSGVGDHTHLIYTPGPLNGGSIYAGYAGYQGGAVQSGAAGAHSHTYSGSTGNTSAGISGSTDSTGSGNPFNEVQPTYISYFRIKL